MWVRYQLKDIVEGIVEQYTYTGKDLFIQYSFFECEGNNEWYLNCMLNTKSEGIYDIDRAEDSDSTHIVCNSWKGNYHTFEYYHMQDNKGCSTDTQVYVVDLYPNFKLKHYNAELWTRGGFTGWNWFVLREPDLNGSTQ